MKTKRDRKVAHDQSHFTLILETCFTSVSCSLPEQLESHFENLFAVTV